MSDRFLPPGEQCLQFQLIPSILEKCYPSLRYNPPDIRQYLHTCWSNINVGCYIYVLVNLILFLENWKIISTTQKNKYEFCFLSDTMGPTGPII